MKFIFPVLLGFLIIVSLAACQQSASPTAGVIKKFPAFPSKYISSRNVAVYLPPGYDAAIKYDVLYVQDGQNVFEKGSSFNSSEWELDEWADKLITTDSIRPIIIVAVWNSKDRFAEYMPAKPVNSVQDALKTDSIQKGKTVLSDEYLKFLVEELKPFIDREFSTYGTAERTAIMGSSMGGLISCYAVNEYPDKFGSAACLSTHWPALKGAYINQLKLGLPDQVSHRFYFDHGTTGLDSLYAPYQQQVDSIMKASGYRFNKNWLTLVFEGAAHNETAWKQRLDQPLKFLFRK